mmetsp:Transcript_48575/g.105817  ORF Transcript_48575/g.105817 Transcript_48575/m.105817 type:complete len:201 (+) Transcript_48575:2149-2751(+)
MRSSPRRGIHSAAGTCRRRSCRQRLRRTCALPNVQGAAPGPRVSAMGTSRDSSRTPPCACPGPSASSPVISTLGAAPSTCTRTCRAATSTQWDPVRRPSWTPAMIWSSRLLPRPGGLPRWRQLELFSGSHPSGSPPRAPLKSASAIPPLGLVWPLATTPQRWGRCTSPESAAPCSSPGSLTRTATSRQMEGCLAGVVASQ